MDCPYCRAVLFWFEEKKSGFGGFLSIFFLFKMGAERENNARKRREWRE